MELGPVCQSASFSVLEGKRLFLHTSLKLEVSKRVSERFRFVLISLDQPLSICCLFRRFLFIFNFCSAAHGQHKKKNCEKIVGFKQADRPFIQDLKYDTCRNGFVRIVLRFLGVQVLFESFS